jgi:hypothetical protein
VVAPTPENVKGYLGAIWPTLSRASPVTVLIILALWTASIYWFTSELARTHAVNQGLWQQLMAAQKAQVDLAWRCYQTEPRHE